MNMLRPSVNQLITKNESSYSLVIGVAKRAREIADELYEEGKTLEEKPVKTAGCRKVPHRGRRRTAALRQNGNTGTAAHLVRRRCRLCCILHV